MEVDIVGINVKVDPVEDEGLYKPQNGFSKEGINDNRTMALKHDTNDGPTEYERYKGVGPFDPVLDVDCREELEHFHDGFAPRTRLVLLREREDAKDDTLVVHIERQRRHHEGETNRHRNVDAANPKHGRNDDEDS